MDRNPHILAKCGDFYPTEICEGLFRARFGGPEMQVVIEWFGGPEIQVVVKFEGPDTPAERVGKSGEAACGQVEMEQDGGAGAVACFARKPCPADDRAVGAKCGVEFIIESWVDGAF